MDKKGHLIFGGGCVRTPPLERYVTDVQNFDGDQIDYYAESMHGVEIRCRLFLTLLQIICGLNEPHNPDRNQMNKYELC